jgi:hypothetical protein
MLSHAASCFIMFVLICTTAFATTLIKVPDDYTTIQDAINAALDYDIIIVRPGTYVETVDFLGKKLIVKSELGPEVTVIDGNQSGSVVSFTTGEDHSSILEGFTLTNGSGTVVGSDVRGGGIYCYDASPEIKGNIVAKNDLAFHAAGKGGGIYMLSSPVRVGRITNNLVINNKASEGGGIYATGSNFINIYYTTIAENEASVMGGGLWAEGQGQYSVGTCILWDNVSPIDPEIHGDPLLGHSNVKGGFPGPGVIDFDPLFYDPANGDCRLRQDPCQPGVVNHCVDSGHGSPGMASGSTRTDGFKDLNTYDMGFHYRTVPLGAIYVPDDYPTIQDAVDVCGNGDTIIVRPGTYHENIVLEDKSVNIVSEKGPTCTVIDGSGWDSVFTYRYSYAVDSKLEGFTITNGYYHEGGGIYVQQSGSLSISNNVITGNDAWETAGGGIWCTRSVSKITGNVITENHGTFGGGISCESGSHALIVNNTIVRNTSAGGGAISCSESSPLIVNNTMVGNEGKIQGKELRSSYNSNPVICNSIIWNAYSQKYPLIMIKYRGNTPSELTISNCNVAGGMAGVKVESGCTLNWGAGMIDASPCFEDIAGYDFHLNWDSPCRDAGDNAAVTELCDFEGDPRIAGIVDIGADEFYYHLYSIGDVLPGAPIDIKVVGAPGFPALLALGTGIQDPPQATPHGDLWLTMPLAKSWRLGAIPNTGILTMPTIVPSGWPSGSTHPFQALVGRWGGGATRLTNMLLLEVE